MCAQIGTLSESGAVFVGMVTDVWPTREVVAGESQRLTLTKLRHQILERWHGTLTADEERYIRTTKDREALERLFGIIQRVRFIVSEVLAGPKIREVYTDTSSCGYRFEPGLTYLMDANRDGPRYQTRACSRTSRVESDDAVEDLKALRAWRTGNPLPPRIYGRFDAHDLHLDTRVRLVDDRGQEERVARVDPSGRFSLDGLVNAKYQLQVEDSRGNGERLIDLSHSSCFEAIPWFSENWHVAGYPVLVEPKQIPIILEPPPLVPLLQ